MADEDVSVVEGPNNLSTISTEHSCNKDNENGCLSKNQQKKLLKIKRWEELKSTKRKMEKEKKKAKKIALRDAGIVVTKKKTVCMAHPDASSVRVSLDLSFNHLMTEKDQRKVVKQVLWSYSANRHSNHPLQLYLTNFDKDNQILFEKFSPGYKSWDIHLKEKSHLHEFEKDHIVYLSSESANVLQALDERKVYIIGGLVDHNSHKGLCFQLAEEAGISHARLPIDEYIKLEGRKILPINHVFEILLHFAEHADWEKAFYNIIPKRKGPKSLEEAVELETNQEIEVSESFHNDVISTIENKTGPPVTLDESDSKQGANEIACKES